ncbi:MAG: YqaE/Pmp3 family membrane protein [Labilibaculum sp.]|nr:YqaE/Pmp3 family membrane protein [Labilibaculum sp.]
MAKRKKVSIIMIILAILFPFLAVGLKKGIGKDLLINIVLCIIGYLPGIIHALWILFS